MEAPMSGINGDRAAHCGPARAWESLSSEHERLVLTAESPAAPVCDGPAQWAELASQRERLIEAAAPLGGLASSSQTTSGPRLVVRAA
jgi:hypothetical protein